MLKKNDPDNFDARIVDYQSWHEDNADHLYFCSECYEELSHVDDTDELFCSECNNLYILDNNELFLVD